MTRSDGEGAGGAARWSLAAMTGALGLLLILAVWLMARPGGGTGREVARNPRPTGPARATRDAAPAATPPPTSEHHPNTGPGVAYLGDRACVTCHEEIGRSYAAHPMGRSLAPIDDPDGGAWPSGGAFEADGLHYAVEARDGTLIHSEAVLDASGATAARTEAEVGYALGSGTRGISFLVERGDGFLYQSPIAWYAQQGRYDLAPGYRGNNSHFERPIPPDCLSCHAGRFEPVAGQANQYRPPVFRDHAISCERCHGPGQLHVEALGARDAEGRPTIVNPDDLDAPLREAVCQQCHLGGEARVARLGRSLSEFRPGLPLEAFLAVFVRDPGGPGGSTHEAVGHTEQMLQSVCYRGSGGTLGCTSCHDPHRKPDPADRVAFYRGRCLECHGDPSACALPEPTRLVQSPADDCTACHMPPAPLADIAHTAQTLHTIPRNAQPASGPAGPASTGPRRLVAFHGDGEEEAADRDRGIALARVAREKASGVEAVALARQAVATLGPALDDRPDDPDGWEAMATALLVLERPVEALQALERGIGQRPSESMMDAATLLNAGVGRFDRASALVDRLVGLNPTRSDYHYNRAQLLAHDGRLAEAAEACREAVRLAPTELDARVLLAQLLDELGRSGAEGPGLGP